MVFTSDKQAVCEPVSPHHVHYSLRSLFVMQDTDGGVKRSKSERFKQIFHHGPLRHSRDSTPPSPPPATRPRDVPGLREQRGIPGDQDSASTLSASAPPSRSNSQFFDGREGESNTSSASGGFFHTRSKPAVASSTSSVSNLFSREKSISFSPAQFLPESLHSKNWALNNNYSIHKNLIKSRVIGKGATAVVRTVQDVNSKQIFAVKVYRKVPPTRDQTPEEYYQRLAEEYIIAKRLNHRNVVRTVELCIDSSDAWCCVMEYCDGGDLFSLIESFKTEGKRMPKSDRNCLFKQLLSGTAHLHEHGVAHRDIKPENLLICANGCLKISDFGVSEIIFDNPDDEIKLCKGLSGSTNYIAPEVFEAKRSNESYDARLVDTWACAIVYINMAFNGLLFAKADKDDHNYLKIRDDIVRFWTIEEEEHVGSDVSEQNSPIVSVPNSRETSILAGRPSIIQLDKEETSESSSSENETEAEKKPSQDENNKPASPPVNKRKPLILFSDFGEAGKKVIAKMLQEDVSRRPLVSEVLQTAFVKKIGLCLPTEDHDIQNSGEKFDATNISSFKNLKDQSVIRNHSHKPPAKAVKTIGMGHM